ncbi:MAG: adenine deaminase [Bacteroidales bacterium]|jgi:adenine deaminase
MIIESKLVDIHTDEIYPVRVTVNVNKIQIIERLNRPADGFLIPGLIDSHIHIESSMVTPSSFAEQAVSRGTTGVVSDPHEIANVLGIDGVKFMMKNAEKVPLKFWFGAPSCVPATKFESAGGTIDQSDIEELLNNEEIKFLAEMMNFPGVINDDTEVHNKLRAALKAGKPIDGHAPGLTGNDLKKYVESGISTDHECTSLREALEKIELGMKILIREGSAARNLSELKSLISTHPDMVMLCSDDLHPETLMGGHIDRLIIELLKEGFDLFKVIRSCTLNPVKHYSLDAGLLRAGDPADFVILSNYLNMDILETWIDGKKVFEKGRTLFTYSCNNVVNNFKSSVITEDQLKVKNEGNRIRVIGVSDGSLLTKELIFNSGKEEFVESDNLNDILKIVVKDRYNDAPPAIAFVKGFGLKTGAFASSVAHDSHNIICVGTNDKDIASAINAIVGTKGGLSVSDNNSVDLLPLPFAGLMSDMPVKNVAAEYERLTSKVRSMGSNLSAPFMTLSFMALLVIPQLKLSDKGLFDSGKFNFVPLFKE